MPVILLVPLFNRKTYINIPKAIIAQFRENSSRKLNFGSCVKNYILKFGEIRFWDLADDKNSCKILNIC